MMHEDSRQIRRVMSELFSSFYGTKNELIPLLQSVQEQFGYLPESAMMEVARFISIPASKVYGTATFYAQFHFKPRGRNIIRVCQGTACHVRGGTKVLTFIQESLGVRVNESTPDLRFSLESVACIGACGLAPVISINEDTHGKLTPGRAVEVLAEYE